MDFQAWLDRWADTILADDFDRFLQMTALPFQMETPGGHWNVDTAQQLRDGFERYRDTVQSLGATLLVRVLRDTEWTSPGDVVLSYENNILNGAQRVAAPTGAQAFLRQEAGEWRAWKLREFQTETMRAVSLPVIRSEELHRH